MPRQIPLSNAFSTGSARTFTIRPRRSRLLYAWWSFLHAAAFAGVAAMGLGVGFSLLAGLALALHAAIGRPARPPEWITHSSGHWQLPESAGRAQVLACVSQSGPWWVRLVFGRRPAQTRILLLRDQLEAPEWRLLRLALQRSRAGPES